MDEILELATKLGKRIATDPRAKSMAEARAALDNSIDDKRLLGDYEKVQRRLHELEQDGKPIEPEDKRALADLHAKVVGSELVKALVKAQMGYAELMQAVSQRVEEEATGQRNPATQ
ncbi:MAG: YlbF family regulator [Phycisphaerales bacterium]|nr:MAG: YlbF family regulator [Phycisphaerales bacterium]